MVEYLNATIKLCEERLRTLKGEGDAFEDNPDKYKTGQRDGKIVVYETVLNILKSQRDRKVVDEEKKLQPHFNTKRNPSRKKGYRR